MQQDELEPYLIVHSVVLVVFRNTFFFFPFFFHPGTAVGTPQYGDRLTSSSRVVVVSEVQW